MLRKIFSPSQIAKLRANGRRDYYGNHVPVALLRGPGSDEARLFCASWPDHARRLWALVDRGDGAPTCDDIDLAVLLTEFDAAGKAPTPEPGFDAGARPLSQFEHQAARDGVLAPEKVLSEPAWLFEPEPNDDHVWRLLKTDEDPLRHVWVLAMFYTLDDPDSIGTLLLCRGPEGLLELHAHDAAGRVPLGPPDPDEIRALADAGPDGRGVLQGRAVVRTDDDDLSDYVRFETFERGGAAPGSA